MKKGKLLTGMLIFCSFFLFTCIPKVSAETVSYYDSVSDGETDQDGYYIVKASTVGELQTALAVANANATAEKPYKVVVKPSDSTYVIDTPIVLYGNTYLYARGATFKQRAGTENNMIRSGDSDNVIGYYYKNIVIDGGVWDENNNKNTLIKIAQAKTVTIKNATFKNVKQGHLMEVAGVNGLSISKCTFQNQVLSTNASVKPYEAIQVDILVNGHMRGYRYQDLANENITITDCTFDNVPRGVGSHTTVLNNPIKGLTISNNTFKNIKSCAIHVMNVINCTVSNNKIESAPRGIAILGAIYNDHDTYLAKTLSSQGNTTSSTPNTYKKPASDMKIIIENNNIKIAGKDPYATYERSGIWVNGCIAETAPKNSAGEKLPKGDYYVSGVTIKGNKVQGNSHGIKLVNVRRSKVMNNNLSFNGSIGKTNYYGVVVKMKASNASISKNSIKKYLNGIYVQEAGADSITSNTIKSVKKYGISIERSTTSKISGNTMNAVPRNGIHIWDKSKVKKIVNNKVTSAKERGIYVGGKSKVTTISGNKFKSCKERIYVNKDSKVSHK